jgi:hypothetical protein
MMYLMGWISLSATWTISSSAASAQRSTSTTYTWFYSGCSSTAGVEHGIVLIGQAGTDFLSQHITAESASLILKHVQANQEFSPPKDKMQLQNSWDLFISMAV